VASSSRSRGQGIGPILDPLRPHSSKVFSGSLVQVVVLSNGLENLFLSRLSMRWIQFDPYVEILPNVGFVFHSFNYFNRHTPVWKVNETFRLTCHEESCVSCDPQREIWDKGNVSGKYEYLSQALWQIACSFSVDKPGWMKQFQCCFMVKGVLLPPPTCLGNYIQARTRWTMISCPVHIFYSLPKLYSAVWSDDSE
jgi:hypothetical protein